ncbi:replicative DNA helicase [Saccharopolyspora sp. K220]|uniref:replicative DNA helicase n=1 Tax=Saccharopolyspora soli TaxID=2926618 RepID=UPI001F5A364A|nr:replicative DNA helicase [Saccharopolyspora soli]MCI2424377.1 replicative DNA helicase [Saccharopolyspora soli]
MSTGIVASDDQDDPNSPHPQLDRANRDVIAAEQSVLGAMLLSQDARIEVPRLLARNDFYLPKHQNIWDAIEALGERGEPADAITTSAELERRGVLPQCGGAPYLHTLIETVPTAMNAMFYAEEVKWISLRRLIASEGHRIIRVADAPGDDREVFVERVSESFERCLRAADGPAADELQPVGADDELLAEFVENLGKRPESAFTTGIVDLDRAMIAKEGALILLAADTGVGKSLLGAQFARHYARDRGERVLFHSLEMSRSEMVERDMSAVSGVPLAEITGVHDLSPTDYDLITEEFVPAYREWGHRLHYVEGRVGVAEVARNGMRLDHQYRKDGGVGLIVFDYLQIGKRPGGVSIERDDLALAAMTSGLKDLAMHLQCVVVAISQFSKEGQKAETPQAYHLKGSSALAQDADVVALMVDAGKDDDARAGEVDVYLPKVRKGVSGRTVTISEQRHKAHFRALGDNDRAAM